MTKLITEPLIALKFFPHLSPEIIAFNKNRIATNDYLLSACFSAINNPNSELSHTTIQKAKVLYKKIVFSNKKFFRNYLLSKSTSDTDYHIIYKLTGVTKDICNNNMFNVDYEHPLKAACYANVIKDINSHQNLNFMDKVNSLFSSLIDKFNIMKNILMKKENDILLLENFSLNNNKKDDVKEKKIKGINNENNKEIKTFDFRKKIKKAS